MANQLERFSAEKRDEMVAKAACFRAGRHGFEGGDPALNWFEAAAGGRHADGVWQELKKSLARVWSELREAFDPVGSHYGTEVGCSDALTQCQGADARSRDPCRGQ